LQDDDRDDVLGWDLLPIPVHPGKEFRKTVTTWRQRTAAYVRSSFLLAYSAFIDNTLVALLQLVKADKLFQRATPWLEDTIATLTGAPPAPCPRHLGHP
jgi:hypothetical protein